MGITERSAYGIVTDLATAGYAVKQKDGRHNRHQMQAPVPLPEPASNSPSAKSSLSSRRPHGAASDRDGTSPEATTASPDAATPVTAAL